MASYDSGECFDSPGLFYDMPVVLTVTTMKQIKLGLSSMNASDRVDFGTSVKTAMTGNANFTTPNPALATLGSNVTDLAAKIAARQNAVDAAKQATEALHASMGTFDLTLTQLAAYVENVTAGDVVKILSSGFAVRNQPTPTTELGQVINLQVGANGYPGVLKARWDPLTGAKLYDAQITTTPDVESSWRSIKPCPAANTDIEDLVSGTRVSVRVRGVVRKLAGPFSSAISCIVP